MAPTIGDPKALARTYDPPSVADAYDLVEQYREVIEYAARHPNRGSSAIANRLDLPRSRIRPWLDNENPSRPDPMRAIRQVDPLEWLRVPPESDVARGLVTLVAWIYSGGSIDADRYVPQFAVDSAADVDRLFAAGELVGIEFVELDRRDTGQGREFKPAEHASLLGRLLSTLDAPVGEKARATDIRLPAVLDDANDDLRVAFAGTYVLNRATRGDRPSSFLAIREERPAGYLDELARFLRDVAGTGVVRRSENNVYLDGEAAASILHGFEKL